MHLVSVCKQPQFLFLFLLKLRGWCCSMNSSRSLGQFTQKLTVMLVLRSRHAGATVNISICLKNTVHGQKTSNDPERNMFYSKYRLNCCGSTRFISDNNGVFDVWVCQCKSVLFITVNVFEFSVFICSVNSFMRRISRDIYMFCYCF